MDSHVKTKHGSYWQSYDYDPSPGSPCVIKKWIANSEQLMPWELKGDALDSPVRNRKVSDAMRAVALAFEICADLGKTSRCPAQLHGIKFTFDRFQAEDFDHNLVNYEIEFFYGFSISGESHQHVVLSNLEGKDSVERVAATIHADIQDESKIALFAELLEGFGYSSLP